MASYIVTNLKDKSSGSLRSIIKKINRLPASNKQVIITFGEQGTIKLNSALPIIQKPTKILGPTQVDLYANLNPGIIIDCHENKGIILGPRSNGSEINGIQIINSSGNGLTILSNNVTVTNCVISHNCKNGIYIKSSRGNTIGTNPNNSSYYISNDLSSNHQNGLYLKLSQQNTIVKNRLMLNKHNGIELNQSNSNTIGGTIYTNSAGQTNNPTGTYNTTTPVFIVPPLGNMISGNLRNGILIRCQSETNKFYGNFIGVTFDGTAAFGNAWDGIRIGNSNDNIFKGCDFSENPFVYYNVVSGNGFNGFHVDNSCGTVIEGNFSGLNATNNAAIANGHNGLKVAGTSAKTAVGGPIPLGNNFSGNKLNGIVVADKASCFLSYNSFCGLASFGGVIPNEQNGILITSCGHHIQLRTNVCSGNKANGIQLGGKANGVNCDPNLCGTDSEGTTALPNGQNGLLITDQAHSNFIGSQTRSIIPTSAFSGNTLNGICIDSEAHDNIIYDCTMGLATTCKSQINNGLYSILLTGHCRQNCIFDCYIDGNGLLDQEAIGNKLVGNYLGLNADHQPFPDDQTKIIDQSKYPNIIIPYVPSLM